MGAAAALLRHPMTGITGSCARAPRGNATRALEKARQRARAFTLLASRRINFSIVVYAYRHASRCSICIEPIVGQRRVTWPRKRRRRKQRRKRPPRRSRFFGNAAEANQKLIHIKARASPPARLILPRLDVVQRP